MILMMHLFFAFFGQPVNTPDVEEVIQRSINVPALDHLLAKSSDGSYEDLAIVSNGLIPLDVDVSKFDKKLQVAKSAAELQTQNVFTVKKIKVGARKARFFFNYKDARVKVVLVKEGTWTVKRYRMKNNKDNVDVTF